MNQIKHLKSLLEKFAAAPRQCVCLHMADEADGELQMFVLFCYFV